MQRSAECRVVSEESASAFERIASLRRNLERVFAGTDEVLDHLLVPLLAGGHVLIEDAPGVGKTTLARALARSIDCTFRRVQFTPDLLPSDILGVSVYHPKDDRFVFKRGPVFANILLADEINRTNPRTQSGLLEAMSEGQVSVDGVSHPLPRPFLVVATQNPFECEGSYPLPDSQLDRFLLRMQVGYPSLDEERRILREQQLGHPLETLEPVLDADAVLELQETTQRVRTEESVLTYLLALVRRTREEQGLRLGASPRGALSLRRAAQAHALLRGRDFLVPDDVKAVAVEVLSHRLIPRSGTSAGTREIVERVLAQVPVPV